MSNSLAVFAAAYVPLLELWVRLIPFAILEELEHSHRGRRRRKRQ